MLLLAFRSALLRLPAAHFALAFGAAALVAGCATDPGDGAPTGASATTELPASTTTTEASAATSTTRAPASTTPGVDELDAPGVGVPLPLSDREFESCGLTECATVEVPIDPAQPELGTIDIAIRVLRSSSPEARLGDLFVNPGGPGQPGQWMATEASSLFRSELLDAFDIVAFDPRGVGASQPDLGCGGRDALSEQTDRVASRVDTPDEILALETAVALCAEETGPAAGYLGTEFVAHDMDAIRMALGAEQISYYGASYGSVLGGFYATLYPESVRAMVVDGALNPIDEIGTQEERTAADSEQLIAFEALLSEALASCDSADCPIYNDGDPTGYYLDAMAKIDLVNEERPNLDNAGLMGVISYLYSEDGWPELHGALFALAQNDDPSALAQSSDQQASESDINERDWVVCLDGWSLSSEIDRETRLGDVDAFAAEYEATAPLLAAPLTDTYYSGFGDTILCPFLDTIAPEPLDIPFDGAEVPILVIGNPSDPATPFTESLELVEDTLSNGYLLEADHSAHVVYVTGGNDCVDDIVHQVLIDIEFPDDRRVVCERL